ncbi:chromosomal replication initiator protein DnaA [Patescibacteria group bacterium]|nr:MAG: chromosomal replication initiator protein DnaA [Patescibacteria group bacterium]
MQDEVWQAVLGEIELSVSRGSFVTWFKRTRLLKCTDDHVVVGVGTIFIKQQMEKRYNDLISKTLAKNNIKPTKIEYRVHASADQPNKIEDTEILGGSSTSAKQAPQAMHHTTMGSATPSKLSLVESNTFENFVVGPGNELAYTACQSVAQDPGGRYNPLYIYGGVGIGKTHLIQSVGNALVAKDPKTRIVYISSEQFVREFVDALRFKRAHEFANRYRSADVLIVDDIQFFAGKDKIQEEFFHTFNALHQAKKQILISSDKAPRDIPLLEERLQSRFAWGMTIDMQMPEFETRCAIVHTKASQHGFELDEDVVSFLANAFPFSLRDLEGGLNRLLAFCEMRGVAPTLAVATSVIGKGQARPKHISPKQIVEKTAKYFQVPLEDIMSAKRDKDIVVPRQIAMYMLREELHMSFPKIAQELGRKDHTTAMHSIDKIAREIAVDSTVKSAVTGIKERLYAA